MEIKIKTYSKINGSGFHIADMIIAKNEIVQFIQPDGDSVFNEVNLGMLPLNLDDVQLRFINKYHKDSDLFNLKIRFPDNTVYGFDLSTAEMIKLKWILKHYWLQKNGNAKWIIGFTIATAIALWKIFM